MTITFNDVAPVIPVRDLDAARIADYLIAERDLVLQGKRGTPFSPPIRKDLSPPGTYRRGVPV